MEDRVASGLWDPTYIQDIPIEVMKFYRIISAIGRGERTSIDSTHISLLSTGEYSVHFYNDQYLTGTKRYHSAVKAAEAVSAGRHI